MDAGRSRAPSFVTPRLVAYCRQCSTPTTGLDVHPTGRSLPDRNACHAELVEGPGIGHEVTRRARGRERGTPGRECQRQQQLIGEMKLDGGTAGMVFAESSHRLVRNCLGMPSSSAVGRKACCQLTVLGQQEDARAWTRSSDELWLDSQRDTKRA